MPENIGRFGLTIPKESDEADGPSQFKTLAEQLNTELGYAGAAGGYCYNEAEQSTESTSFTTLGTPDQVTGLVVPAHGFIEVVFSALWKESIAGVGRAAIFVGANQISAPNSAGSHSTLSACTGSESNANEFTALMSSPLGLQSAQPGTSTASIGKPSVVGFISLTELPLYLCIANAVTKIQTDLAGVHHVAGGRCLIEAPEAATYTIAVQYLATSGKVSAKQRVLGAWTKEFA